jgi:acyl carrier protein
LVPILRITGEIRDFLSSAISERVLGDSEDFFALGYVNSLMALELVTYVERRFDVVVEVEDLDLDNFRTISRIADFVRRKQAAGVPSGHGSGRPD